MLRIAPRARDQKHTDPTLADEESEEIPVLEVRTDFFKRKGTTHKAGSSRKNKKKD